MYKNQYKIIKKFYNNKRVLITGATGFKGSWLAFWLSKIGAKFLLLETILIKIKVYFMDSI